MSFDLAVVIVTWNVRELALQTLQSLYADLATTSLDAQVWVVDNASADHTVEAIRAQFPQTKVIASDENLGFVRANNLALQQIGFGGAANIAELPKAVYLLNPDTITQTGATQALFDALMNTPQAGLVGAQLSYADGSFQAGAFAFPGLRQLWVEFFPTPGRLIEGEFNGRYSRALYTGDQPFEVDFVLGATMMLKREVIAQVGLLDEAFFMYCEEIDWAWRIHKAGWKVFCVPHARVVHLVGQSSSQAKPQTTIYLWTSRALLYKKHHPTWKAWLARLLMRVGLRRRMKQPETPAPMRDAYQRLLETL